jgi:hypothetical protein
MLVGWEAPVMLSHYDHLRPIQFWKAVQDLTQLRTETEKWTGQRKDAEMLNDVVSRLGLEPRTLALKGHHAAHSIQLNPTIRIVRLPCPFFILDLFGVFRNQFTDSTRTGCHYYLIRFRHSS